MKANARQRVSIESGVIVAFTLGMWLCSASTAAAGMEDRLPKVPELPRISEQITIQQNSGLALDGFDPVAYFTAGRAVGGQARFELQHKGIVWRFATDANRSAFDRDPEVYAPQFGGYDPVGVANGRAVTSDPGYFLVTEGTLLLFRNAQNRARWLSEPDLKGMAQRNWASVSAQLVH